MKNKQFKSKFSAIRTPANADIESLKLAQLLNSTSYLHSNDNRNKADASSPTS